MPKRKRVELGLRLAASRTGYGCMTQKKKESVAARRAGMKQRKASFDAAARRVFLDHLAQTANVAASARMANVSTSRVYALRRKSDVFRSDWSAALAEGFARLEMELLAEALATPRGDIKDSTLKARAQKHRLALALLAAHRASVKGGGSPKTVPSSACEPTVEEKRSELISRIGQMRERLAANSAE